MVPGSGKAQHDLHGRLVTVDADLLDALGRNQVFLEVGIDIGASLASIWSLLTSAMIYSWNQKPVPAGHRVKIDRELYMIQPQRGALLPIRDTTSPCRSYGILLRLFRNGFMVLGHTQHVSGKPHHPGHQRPALRQRADPPRAHGRVHPDRHLGALPETARPRLHLRLRRRCPRHADHAARRARKASRRSS